MTAKPFREYLKDLAQEQKTSVSRTLWKAAKPDVKGLAPDTLKKALAGDRPLHAFQIKAIVEALDVDPQDVPHYRMAIIREELDERVVGPDRALEALRRLEAGPRRPAQEARDEFLELAEEAAERTREQRERRDASSRSRGAKDQRS